MKKLFLTLVMGLCAMALTFANVNHIVEPGETLKSIAQKYGITEAKIIELNPDAAQFIYVGMELNIPANAPSAQATTTPNSGNQTQNYNSSQSVETGDYIRIDSDGNPVYHYSFLSAQYQASDFEDMKLSGSYGIGWYITSISHWGRFHVGANANFGVNEGLVDEGGCIFDFGPSLRLDITDHCFINMPIDATVVCTFPKGTSKTKTDWGAKIMPSLHVFTSNRFGIFLGPQITFGDGATSFGGYAGISYCF